MPKQPKLEISDFDHMVFNMICIDCRQGAGVCFCERVDRLFDQEDMPKTDSKTVKETA